MYGPKKLFESAPSARCFSSRASCAAAPPSLGRPPSKPGFDAGCLVSSARSHTHFFACVRACDCARERARARVRLRVCARVRLSPCAFRPSPGACCAFPPLVKPESDRPDPTPHSPLRALCERRLASGASLDGLSPAPTAQSQHAKRRKGGELGKGKGGLGDRGGGKTGYASIPSPPPPRPLSTVALSGAGAGGGVGGLSWAVPLNEASTHPSTRNARTLRRVAGVRRKRGGGGGRGRARGV